MASNTGECTYVTLQSVLPESWGKSVCFIPAISTARPGHKTNTFNSISVHWTKLTPPLHWNLKLESVNQNLSMGNIPSNTRIFSYTPIRRESSQSENIGTLVTIMYINVISCHDLQMLFMSPRKWFKSTLVLVPLFGVHYALLLAVSFAANLSESLEIAWLYIDQTFSSFQVRKSLRTSF